MKHHPIDRIAFIGGHAPRRCGIATFTTDLSEAVRAAAPEADSFTVAVNDHQSAYTYPSTVRFEITERDPDSYRRTADFLNFRNVDVLCLQHEFGIYGGPAGSHILALLREARMPVVTTLHTVLSTPDVAQRKVMEELILRSERLVVMAEKGRQILVETYDADPGRIDLIPHGIPDMAMQDSMPFKARMGLHGRTMLMTFGLLGPGKGIEYAIRALPEIVARHPDVVYVILGATHPHLIAREGEAYRMTLERLAEDCGVKSHVIFHDRFVSMDELKDYIAATDIYVTPYPNEAQITSGTLAQVFGAGKPVISTPYWHAQELLSDGKGVLVPVRDSKAIGSAALALLDDPGELARIRERAWQDGRGMIWSAVAGQYLESFQKAKAQRLEAPQGSFSGASVASRFILPAIKLDHLFRLTDSTGMFQHATYSVPNYAEGYCTDDNARSFLLCSLLDEQAGVSTEDDLDRVLTTYLAFLAAAMNGGRFRNFMSYDRRWLEDVGSEDSHGRAVWALGTGAARSRNDGHRLLCSHLFQEALNTLESFTSPRSWAGALLGINEFLKTYPGHGRAAEMRQLLTGRLMEQWRKFSDQEWPWFESSLSYDNARLSQALIQSGYFMADSGLLETGLVSLRWLASIQTTPAGHFRPIGSNGFYQRNGPRADFDQQPLEAQAMVSACLDAYRATSDPDWQREARRAFEWFLGRNDLGLPLYDSRTGGCCDGLHPDRVNANQGAESTLAFKLSLVEMHRAQHALSEPMKQTA